MSSSLALRLAAAPIAATTVFGRVVAWPVVRFHCSTMLELGKNSAASRRSLYLSGSVESSRSLRAFASVFWEAVGLEVMMAAATDVFDGGIVMRCRRRVCLVCEAVHENFQSGQNCVGCAEPEAEGREHVRQGWSECCKVLVRYCIKYCTTSTTRIE